MKRWFGLLTTLAIAGAALVVSGGPAHAVVPGPHGCKFTGTNPTIDIVNHASPAYRDAVIGAANDWNRTDAAGKFNMATSGANLNVYTAYWEDYETWAETVYGCQNGRYTSVTLTFNRTTMDVNSGINGFTPHQRKIVAIHELGHVYGLGHVVNMNCLGRPTVMQQGRNKFSCPGTAPWADDVIGVNNIY